MCRTLLTAIAVVSLCGVLQSAHAAQAQKAASTRPAPKPAAAAAPININTASAGDLSTLPGIGAKTAERIIEYRQKNGPFTKIEQLMNVRGVGEKNFLKLRTQINVGAPKAEQAAPPQR
jgi:competence protein ComEA